jgi:hypothetical protein
MGTFEWIMGIIIACVLAFQVWLTVRVFRSNMFERKQKVWQAQIIWLIPIIGAGLVFSILQEEAAQDRRPPPELKG